MKISAISFCGIEKPFIDNNGNRITPIAKKPDEDDIKKAFEAIKRENFLGNGANGEVFSLGQDLVVKKHKGKNAYNQDTQREIAMLDKMFDSGVKLQNSQEGKFAIENSHDTLIVSSLVKGEGINSVSNPFNKEKFESLLSAICETDIGYIMKNSSKTGGSNRCRLMNYDFNLGNVKFDKNQAGFFDFENSKFENIDDMISERVIGIMNKDGVIVKKGNVNSHRSDTSELPSSLKSFEFYGLHDYLLKTPDTYDVLNTYLIEKGKYHKNMSEFYKNFANESSHKNVVLDIAKRENAHSELLKPDKNGNVSSDIMQAEIMKIQSANFMHKASSHTRSGIINQKQLKDYMQSSIEYYKKMLDKAEQENDKNRITYYNNSLSLMKDWNNINANIQREIDKNNPKYTKKLTQEHIKTLDDAVIESSMPDRIKEIIPENFVLKVQEQTPIGEGANSKVYAIPNNDEYVLKILKHGDPNKIPVGLFPDNINVGQPVWISPISNAMILKKLPGVEHSIPNWSKTILNETINPPMPEHITKEQAEIYFSKTDKIASMSDKAFDKLAEKVKLISDKGYKLDPINANNLMVGDDEINVIDFWKVNDWEKHLYQNSALDMTAVILDFVLFPEYYDKLDEDKKQKLIKNVEIIKDKVNKSSEKVGIDTKEDKFKTYIRTTSRWFTAHSIFENDKPYFRYYDVRMEDFLKTVRNPKEWAEQRNEEL